MTGHREVEGKHAGQLHPQSVASVILPHPACPLRVMTAERGEGCCHASGD